MTILWGFGPTAFLMNNLSLKSIPGDFESNSLAMGTIDMLASFTASFFANKASGRLLFSTYGTLAALASFAIIANDTS
eukprot:CAMPEP_0185598230 /NCGR_PEP_ID=MMETSP0434-20130131/81867_1 /TAXON_ID=626734 ORGANISM="Favella taraikaensis, Strain Fe Narragansett Bay" /NCGR_SAMPLE_ID=MMETSP0434 /ASSEMBLY_ACC=CAM_ASM_000379 /LENGTH=77 /DNA_ID=CAMNT_0028227167 /DNA_START=1089 /DNA_END=1322 /DNA_ORIENTATION=-